MKEKKKRSRAPPRGRQRERMRPWLEKQLNSGECPGLKWRNKDGKVFAISWKHASGRTWSQTSDSEIFKRYAMHTGKFQEGQEPDPKKWKANFRCALNSLPDVEELKDETHKKGERAERVYQFKDHSSSASKRKSNTENVSVRKRARYDSSEDSSQDTDTTEDESPALQSPQGTHVKTEVKEEEDLNQCLEPDTKELFMEDSRTDHDYSQRETSQSGIPNLPALFNPDLQSGGSVIIQGREHYTSQVSYDDLKSLIPGGSKIADGDLDSSSTDSGENMTDEEVVDMVDSMRRSRAEEGFSESDSACSGSPQSSPQSHLWNYHFLEMSGPAKAVRVYPDNEAAVITQPILESQDWNITALRSSTL